MGPCGVNEVTCHVSGYDENGLLTYDWKHFPLEDYDDWMWGTSGPWGLESKETRRPDILVLGGMGLHSCWHAHPEINRMFPNNGVSKLSLDDHHIDHEHIQVNDTLIASHASSVPRLMKLVKLALSKVNLNSTDSSNREHTRVIISTVGMTFIPRVDICINQFNKIVTDAAHEQGFPVFDRGEIERRLMRKSIGHNKPLLLNDVHLERPGPAITSTALLGMITCLRNNSIDAAAATAAESTTR